MRAERGKRLRNPSRREDELGGKTLVVVGPGQIGGRLAWLAKPFDMRVIGLRPTRPPAEVRPARCTRCRNLPLFPEADFVPRLSAEESEVLVDAFQRMNPSAYLVNVALGRLVDRGGAG
jgi:D-2-hydroxyacid dehydrogenase (NADP+)